MTLDIHPALAAFLFALVALVVARLTDTKHGDSPESDDDRG